MNSLLLLTLAVAIPSALSQDVPDGWEEEPFCKPDGIATNEEVRDHIIGNIDDARAMVSSGKQANGGGSLLPRAKQLRKMTYGCSLEKKAKNLLGKQCTDKAPSIPATFTGLFFKFDDEEDLSFVTAIDMWRQEIDYTPFSDASIKSDSVTYEGDDVFNSNYANLIRHDYTRIGCAQLHCNNGGVKYRALCLLNRPPLKKGDAVYYIKP